MGIIQFVRDAIASDTRERLAFCAVILISITPAALAKVVQEGNFFELDFDFDFCKKWQKPGPSFWKRPEKFCKRQSQNRKIAVRTPSIIVVGYSYFY